MMDKKGLIHKITDDLGITKYALCIDGSCAPNQHKCVRTQLNDIIAELLEKGIIKFNREKKKYELG